MNKISKTLLSTLPLTVLLLSACSGGGGGSTTPSSSTTPGSGTTPGDGTTPGEATPSSYTIGGAVAGLTGSVVLQNNSGDDLTVNASGNPTFFTLASVVNDNGTYAVTVLTQPTGQTCSVSTGAGTVSGNNVTNVGVTCATNAYTVGGSVSGLTGSVVLQDNHGDNLTVSANGAYTFAAPVAYSSPYAITVLTQPAGQSCSIANGTGTIPATNVSDVGITCSTYTHTVGGAVSGLNGSVVLQNNGADNTTISVNGPFNFPTAVNYGNPYNVTVLSQQLAFPNYACIVSSGSGTIGANVSDIGVACAKFTAPRYVYAISNNNSVSISVVDAASGRLKYIGSTATGLNLRSVTVHPSGKYAYVLSTNSNPGIVSQYSIGADGSFTEIGVAVATGALPDSLTVDPTGKYAYVANGNSYTVSQYSIGADGALTEIGTAVAAGDTPRSVTVDPTGKYAYVANSGGGTVSQYSIGATGALTEIGFEVAAGASPQSVTVDPTGKYAYVANSGGTVSQYSIGTYGALTAVGLSVAAGASPQAVTVDPTGKYAYVANQAGGTVSQYTINAGGRLTAMTTPTVAAGTNPNSITFDPLGKYAYVGTGGAGILQYSIGETGALTLIPTASVRSYYQSLVVSSGIAPLQAVEKYVYVANSAENTISQYTIGTDGALTAMATPTVAAGGTPQFVTVTPSGKYAYVKNLSGNSVSQYSIGADGALTATATLAVGGNSITIDPSGTYIYVTAQDSWRPGAVYKYYIGPDGAFYASGAAIATGADPQSITIDPTGQYAYVPNYLDSTISQYSIGALGVLTAMVPATVATGATPTSFTIDPTGKYAYAVNQNPNTVSQYSIGATGALTEIGTAVATGLNPQSITVNPTGKYAYVTNLGDFINPGTVSQYSIAADGALTEIGVAVAAGAQPRFVTVDSAGKYAYVANGMGGTISQYSIGTDGALTAMSTVAAGTSSYPVPYSITTVTGYQ